MTTTRPANAPAVDAPLPPQLSDLCQRVARMTRLRRAERADVERELQSHFREALTAGHSAHDAATSFGDPKSAARDLRAATIAKRSPLDRALGKTMKFTGIAAAAIALAYAGLAAYLHVQTPVISIDSLERVHASLAAPAKPEDAAWPHYRRALLALRLAHGDAADKSAGAEVFRDNPYPGTHNWPAATAWLGAHADGLATLRDAARRPVLGLPIGREFDAMDAPLFGESAVTEMRETIATQDDPRKFPVMALGLPHLGRLRLAGQILAADAMDAAEKGDSERFVGDVETSLRLSIHCQDGRFLVSELVGIAIRHLITQRTVAALEWKPDLLDAAQLARLQRAFESIPAALQQMDLAAERLLFEDIVQRVYTDDGAGNGIFRLDRASLMPLIGNIESMSLGATSGGSSSRTVDPVLLATIVSGPVAAFTVADRRETMEFVDRWLRRFETTSALPLRDRAKFEAMDREFEEEVGSRPAHFLLPKLLMPAVLRASSYMAQDRAQLAAAATACAALRWRVEHGGAWPARVEDLVPAYVDAVPEDPWLGAPVRMAGDGVSFRIWSVGEDGIDDAGDPDAQDGRTTDVGPSTLSLRNSLNSYGTTASPPDRPKVDWVWFAPRGNFDRWKPRQPNSG